MPTTLFLLDESSGSKNRKLERVKLDDIANVEFRDASMQQLVSRLKFICTQEKMQAAADELFDLVLKKKIQLRIDQRYTLDQAGQAHTDLAGRKTTGASVFVLE